jgi:hypothetical protein
MLHILVTYKKFWACAGAAVALVAIMGCASARNYLYTGEQTLHCIEYLPPHLYAYDTDEIADFGMPALPFVQHNRREPRLYRYLKADTLAEAGEQNLAISINRCFVKYLADLGPSKEVLAFVEVTDHADNIVRRRVFFDDQFVPEGHYLNFSGATVYGSRPFKGKPITVEFSVVELDQEENEVAIEAIRQIKDTVKIASPEAAPVSNLLADIVMGIVGTNVDDRELHLRVELSPITVENPEKIDSSIAGNLLRVGNYVVVKQEAKNRKASVASKMPFTDELIWPAWVKGSAQGQYPPNILYYGGQLYVTRAFQSKLAKSEGALGLGPRYVDDDLPAALRQPKLSGALLPSDDDFNYKRGLAEIVGLYDGFPDPITGEIPQGEAQDVDPVTWVAADYVPYRNKSYLSFTVRDDRPPIDAEILDALSQASSERISDVVLTLSAEQKKTILTEVGASLRTSLVRLLARRELRKAKTQEETEAQREQLMQRFSAEYKAAIDAEVDIRTARINELESRTGTKTNDWPLFRKNLEAALPALRQDDFGLAWFAERLLQVDFSNKEPQGDNP